MDAGPKRVFPLSAFQITETKEKGMMVITTTRVAQMRDKVKMLQDGPKSTKRSSGVRARGWENSLRKHGKTIMKYRATRPLQRVVKISVEAKTSVCQANVRCFSLH